LDSSPFSTHNFSLQVKWITALGGLEKYKLPKEGERFDTFLEHHELPALTRAKFAKKLTGMKSTYKKEKDRCKFKTFRLISSGHNRLPAITTRAGLVALLNKMIISSSASKEKG